MTKITPPSTREQRKERGCYALLEKIPGDKNENFEIYCCFPRNKKKPVRFVTEGFASKKSPACIECCISTCMFTIKRWSRVEKLKRHIAKKEAQLKDLRDSFSKVPVRYKDCKKG